MRRRSSSSRVFPKVVTVSSKGQITIPRRYMRRYGLQPGDAVEITIAGRSMRVRPARTMKEVPR
jgi:AbrB family looped-hinge helix DNA binding protein